jgi:hypothetical protein
MLLWNLVERNWKPSAASRGDFYFTLEGIYGFWAAVCYHRWLGAKRNCDLGAGGREFKSRRPDRRRGPGSGAFPVVAEAAGTSTPPSVSTVGWLDFANETDARSEPERWSRDRTTRTRSGLAGK